MKRSALRRTPMTAETRIEPRKCKHCRKRTEGPALHDECVGAWWEANREKVKARAEMAKAKAARADRAETKQKLIAHQTPHRRALTAKAKAQTAFNKWVRARDAHMPCVSCGTTNPPMTPGGQWDAGHFLTRGAHPELAFDEDNCHKQCKRCNAGGGKFSHKARTVNEKYEEELLVRIGPDRLAALKGPHEVVPRTDDYWKAVEATYKAKLAQLKKEQS